MKTPYPDNWKEISRKLKAAAKGKCNLCGMIENGYCWSKSKKRFYKVVLACVHLGMPKPDGSPGDKNDCADVRPENLAVLCQACHLAIDVSQHQQNQAIRKRQLLLDSSQQNLFEELP